MKEAPYPGSTVLGDVALEVRLGYSWALPPLLTWIQ